MGLRVDLKEKEKGVFLVLLSGSIDTQTYSLLEEKVNPFLKQAKAIIFDMKDVSYISSMGLSAIFRIKKILEDSSGTIAIINLQPQVKKVLEIIKVLPEYYFSTMQEAEKYLDEFLADMQKRELEKGKENNE